MKKFLMALMFAPSLLLAQELPKEMTMPTDVGEIVLTVEECALSKYIPYSGFDYKAYATEEGHDDHLGCWMEDGQLVHIFFPEIWATATYDKRYFRPRVK